MPSRPVRSGHAAVLGLTSLGTEHFFSCVVFRVDSHIFDCGISRTRDEVGSYWEGGWANIINDVAETREPVVSAGDKRFPWNLLIMVHQFNTMSREPCATSWPARVHCASVVT